jgi:PKHD-type hydroxylase
MRGSLAMRADVSVTVFLSEPSDYAGGELLIASNQTPVAIKAAAGDAVLYPSGSIHQVNPVETGVRLVAVTWLQSMVRSVEQRRVLFQLSEAITALESQGLGGDGMLRLRATHNDLLRMWADV